MQARSRSCFLQHTRNTTHSKLQKGALKIQPQMKHTNTPTTPKCNFAPRDDDTRSRPPTQIARRHPEALACGWPHMAREKRQIPHCELAKWNHAAKIATPTTKYWKRVTETLLKAVGMTYVKGRKPEAVVSAETLVANSNTRVNKWT